MARKRRGLDVRRALYNIWAAISPDALPDYDFHRTSEQEYRARRNMIKYGTVNRPRRRRRFGRRRR